MPPLVGVAVKVTLEPAQIAPEGLATILTLAGEFGLTIITIALLVAGEPVAQVLLLVIATVTESLFTKVDDVKVELLVPAFTPFTCH